MHEIADILQAANGGIRLKDMDGFIYQRGDVKKSGKTYWRCQMWRKEKCSCKAKVYTFDDVIVTRSGSHNHDAC